MTERLLAPVDAAAAWLTRPVPIARIAWLRAILYAFIWVDVLLTTAWVGQHDTAPGSFYQPLLIGRILHLPTPGFGFVRTVEVLLLACAAVAATGRLPRVAGAAVFLLYGEWMVVAMSYGKVDHDRFAFLVALAVLPLVGRARFTDRRPSEAAGFAVRATMLAVVATYFLSVVAKARFGPGLWNWVNSAVFVRAISRRSTGLSNLLLPHPQLLVVAQYGLVTMEILSPLLLVLRRRALYLGIVAYVLFHVTTYLMIRIIFLPHLMCFLAFLPLERLVPAREWGQAAPGRSDGGSAQAAVPPGSRDRLAETQA